MTTVISRLYADAKTANTVLASLKAKGFQDDMIDLIKPGPSNVAAIEQARVGSENAQAYAQHLKDKSALVVTRVPLMPAGAARAAIAIMDAEASVNAGVANQNEYIREKVDSSRFSSVLSDHRRFASMDLTPGYSERYGLVAQAFGLRALSAHRTKRSAIAGGGFKSRLFWPMPLLKKKDGSNSAISGGAYMSRLFWPMPLLAKRGSAAAL